LTEDHPAASVMPLIQSLCLNPKSIFEQTGSGGMLRETLCTALPKTFFS